LDKGWREKDRRQYSFPPNSFGPTISFKQTKSESCYWCVSWSELPFQNHYNLRFAVVSKNGPFLLDTWQIIIILCFILSRGVLAIVKLERGSSFFTRRGLSIRLFSSQTIPTLVYHIHEQELSWRLTVLMSNNGISIKQIISTVAFATASSTASR